jgi:CubicO group peptidase (beta-lactamase class C family)
VTYKWFGPACALAGTLLMFNDTVVQRATSVRDITGNLPGLWGSEQVLGPNVRGALTILRTTSGWKATIAGREMSVGITGDTVSLTLPDGSGELRARLSADHSQISGQWIQPAPFGNTLRYTSAVRLAAHGRLGSRTAEWRGLVTPLEDRLSLYLLVERQSDGSVTALLRNPEGNVGDGRFRVSVSGRLLRLVDVNDSTRALDAEFGSHGDALTLRLPGLGEVRLTRRDRSHARGFYPRSPARALQEYRRPLDDGDGWPIARSADVGMDPKPLASLVQRLADVDPGARGAMLVHSVQIARHGKLVLDEYFFGFDRRRPHDLRSGSKTFASVLLGIAAESGASVTPRDRVYALFPQYAPFADRDPRKLDMTVEHLMTMTSGLPCDENSDEVLSGNEDRMQAQAAQPDWYRYMLELPLAHAPGSHVGYCSGGVNLVGGIVQTVTRTWLPTFFHQSLASPLGFREYHLNLSPTGSAYLGGGAYLRPRDFLKLGQVYVSGGIWNGVSVVNPSWIEQSTTCRVHVQEQCADGYDWHLHELRAGARSYREYEANGNGGQFLIVLPELDIVVVFTAGNYGSYGVWRKLRDELVPQYVIASVAASGQR